MIRFTVWGQPRPQGSLAVWRTPTGTKAHVAHQGGVPFLRWRASVTNAAIEAFAATGPIAGPVRVQLVFRLEPHRPRTAYPTGHPDLDKLVRCVLDALGGVAYADDSQVVDVIATKRWSDQYRSPGVTVTVLGDVQADQVLPEPSDLNPYPDA